MAINIFKTLKEGQDYSKLWPQEASLNAIFPEPKIIAATRFGIQYMPPVSIAVVAIVLNLMGQHALPQAVAMGLMVLSFPVQGLYWLGMRAKTDLPPQTGAWYREIHTKMQQNGCNLQQLEKKPTYRSLAYLLKVAFSQLDASFRKEWF